MYPCANLGVVVLDQPVALSAYGSLPSLHELDGAVGTSLTVVGYGAQDWVPAPHGRFPVFTFVRTRAECRLISTNFATADEFVRVSTNPGGGKGGIGPGDSGAPAFLDSSTTIGAIGSHGASPFGSGSVYFTRLDTAEALAFITPFLSSS